MKEMFRRWNFYGCDVDVFDKHREAVRKSNQGAVRVFSVLAILSSLTILVFGLLTNQPPEGAVFCVFQLAAGIFGAVTAFRQNCTRNLLLVAGYLLTAATYALSIYGSHAFNNEALWIGSLVVVACYLYDYAWRIGILQILCYLAVRLMWFITRTAVSPQDKLFSVFFLLLSLVTFYTLNRTRTTLIMSREKSQQDADTDLLTGLTARISAQKEIEEHLKTDDHGVLMLLDLDRFKSVNDRLGHQIGDKVLVDVAADLKNMFRNSDVLSRLGGDEFVVYLKSVPERDWAQQRADQIVREVRRWVGNGTTNIQVTASVGIVMTDMVSRNYDDLYRAADIAMYTVKHEGGNKALFYTPDMLDSREAAEESVRIEAPGRDNNHILR